VDIRVHLLRQSFASVLPWRSNLPIELSRIVTRQRGFLISIKPLGNTVDEIDSADFAH
jgi:hypothetical protein